MKNNVVHRIVQGDCLEVMKKIPDNTVSFICADFPYNISNNPWLTMRNDKIVRADFWEWDKFESDEVYLDFVFSVCEEYKRILKPNWSLVLFFSYQYSWWIGYELKRRGLFSFRVPLIFEKTNPLPRIRKNGFRSCYEVWIWLVNDEWKYNFPKTFNFLDQRIMKNILPYKIGQSWEKLTKHPTEKPQRLIEYLVAIFTNPGDIVLDSFAGSWTTWIASYKLWRHCISIEKESWFVKMIQNRQIEIEKEA